MNKARFWAVWLVFAGLPTGGAASADLYSAAQAYEKQDFTRAFEMYRELAELGQPDAQENLAAMYVGGEGVKRDNVLGYAWALIANEHGGGEAMQNIISQLEPHLTDSARRKVAELQGQFGLTALQTNLLPAARKPAPLTKNPDACAMARPVNPDDYFPQGAKRDLISGNVLLEFTVWPDGRVHNPRVLYSLPALVFDEAARQVVFNSGFKPQRENGVAVPCTMRIQMKFTIHEAGMKTDLDEKFAATRQKAIDGDAVSQMVYGLLLGRPDLNHTNEEAMPWFLKAAQAGIPSAQFMVGSYIMIGAGVEPEEKKGLVWLTMAANAGQANAQVALANYALRGHPDAAAYVDARKWLEQAVAAGNHEAKFYLAAMLAANPDAEQRDPKRALEMLATVMSDVDGDPTSFEIRAAAHAMLGEFADAQKDQKKALRKAQGYGWDVAPQQARLKNYESNTTWTGDLVIP